MSDTDEEDQDILDLYWVNKFEEDLGDDEITAASRRKSLCHAFCIANCW